MRCRQRAARLQNPIVLQEIDAVSEEDTVGLGVPLDALDREQMVDAVLSGKEVPVNDTKTYNNGVKVVPSYLLKPVVVDKSNWEKTLVEGGYYKRAQIQ